jgi:predicted alpha/beta superfamily hydrolase
MNAIASVIALFSGFAGLQTLQASPYTIGQYHTIRSQVLGEEHGYCVYLPHDYKQSRDAYPVLYLLDGHRHFHYASGIVDYLSRYPKAIPPLILVDIEQQHRSRDMTPTKSAQRPTQTGGAKQFLEFLHTELIPHIDAQYRTTSPRIISGHSLSGLFAMYALLNQPELFDAHIMSSPGIWWDDHLLLRQAEPFLQRHKRLEKFVYFGVGGQERQVVQDYYEEFQRIVRQHCPEEFRAVVERLEDESHGTICIPVFYRGLKALFATPKQDRKDG